VHAAATGESVVAPQVVLTQVHVVTFDPADVFQSLLGA